MIWVGHFFFSRKGEGYKKYYHKIRMHEGNMVLAQTDKSAR